MELVGRAAWANTVEAFLKADVWTVQSALQDAYQDANAAQVKSWMTCIKSCRTSLEAVVRGTPAAASWWIAFEYELPREGGRRPDVCILTRDALLVIEYKDSTAHTIAGMEQCSAYVRDFQEYHLESRGRAVCGALLVSGYAGEALGRNDCTVIAPRHLGGILERLPPTPPTLEEARAWLSSPYRPLPSLIQAAKLIFENEPLPQIRQAASAGIPQALEVIKSVAQRSKEDGSHHLILLTGSPGAGKTLVGLQFVHLFSEAKDGGDRAVFLSGNGPLVEVLQYVLGSKVFVQDVHRFITEHGVKNTRDPVEERVLIFDEAQRAWDLDKMAEKRNVHSSEPDLFVEIASRNPHGSVVLGLIGQGQEIHTGEESGIGQWQEALLKSDKTWTVHCPPTVATSFPAVDIVEHPALDLTTSLRSHLARDLHAWADSLLSGDLSGAARQAKFLRQAHFHLYVTSDLDRAKEYLHARYRDEPEKTYGIVASSKSKNLVNYGLDTGFNSRDIVPLQRQKAGPWFHGRGGTESKCRLLRQAVTEFSCQGLELDGVLVAWGRDLIHDGARWARPSYHARNTAKDPHQLRINSYRVLLTRARDGLIAFCPPGAEMEQTREALERAGFAALPME